MMSRRNSRNSPAGNKPVNFEIYRDLPVQHISTTNNLKKADNKHAFKASCDFDYLAEKFTLSLHSGHFTFQPTSVKSYFRKQSIATCIYDQNEKVRKPNQVFVAFASFHNCPIDFFGFSADRTFNINFVFQSNGATLEAVFDVTLPVIKQSDLHFSAPGTTFPDASIRRICKQAFRMNDGNSKEEIKQCIMLEEFKLVPIVDRYKAFGYVDMLNLFLHIENSFELDLVQKYNMINVTVEKMSGIRYKINTAGQVSSSAASVCLTPMDALLYKLEAKELANLQICCPIVNYHRNYVVIELKRNGKGKDIQKERLFHVEFRPNFFSNAMAQRALRRITTIGYENFMLDFSRESLPVPAIVNFQQFENIEWLNPNVGANAPQSMAVKCILNRNNFPSPYIVFGPPGTGKTSTLVEAVAQIVKLLPTAKVMVTVNSNSACDEIGERLLKYAGANKVFRFYSPSFSKKMERVHPKLKPCSNLKYNYHIQPSVQEMLSYNVIITTLVNSGRLLQLGPSHFDFIVIDECASSSEPYVDIPIMVAMKLGAKFKASVVLLGDPKQLGQIVRTFHSERYGFNISMMERVMKMKNYLFDPVNKKYDSNYIVQLTDNFRSHHSILSFSNQQFYNSILQAKQQEKVANFAIGWHLLPNPECPIIFQASWTESEIDGTSLYNEGDINFVKKYVYSLLNNGINGKKVHAKDIGIISPYAAQREKLKETFKMGLEIGTVEYFQGREKLIIILSTVRSKTPTIGFLKNEKRLNVALTRAKALLIVIGNPETLGKNVFWQQFIQMCSTKKAIVGKVPKWVRNKTVVPPETEEDKDEDIRLEEMMNGMSIDD